MAKKRITELATETTLKNGQYVAIDHTTDGTKKLNLGAELTNLKEDLEQTTEALQTKAEIDGAYDNMTVGNAEQLISTVFVEDSTPYKFRTTGGSVDVGDREYVDAIVGGTVAWNQLVQNGNFADASGWTTSSVGLSVANNVATLTALSTIATAASLYRNVSIPRVSGHKYLFHIEITPSVQTTVRAVYDGYGIVGDTSINANTKTELTAIGTSTASNTGFLYLYVNRGDAMSEGDTVKVENLYIIDLTLMFGSTIADYIYSLEQANAGAGVAWFKKLFPKDYYEYNEGELISISGLQSHGMVGFNQWDEEWESGSYNITTGEKAVDANNIRSKNRIPVVPNTTYYFRQETATSNALLFYDASGNYISYLSRTGNNSFSTPENAYFMSFYLSSGYGTTYKNDICINLHWSGTRDGEYEPYVKHSYPLDSSLTLRGIPKQDENGELYYDGDRYLPDGTVERRCAEVDLGDLQWIYSGTSGQEYFYAPLTIIAKNYSSENIPIVSDRYTQMQYSSLNGHNGAIGISSSGNYIKVCNLAYDNATDFKTAMSGAMITYEVATPTTEQADPYQTPQIVDDWGTEEYVTESIVPVGHVTKYPANLRDKVQHLPNLADDDGFYLVQQVGTQMNLVAFHIPKATGLADGTYTLKATVSGGTPTYTWESES